MTYVAQFLQYSNDMPAPDDDMQVNHSFKSLCHIVFTPTKYTRLISQSIALLMWWNQDAELQSDRLAASVGCSILFRPLLPLFPATFISANWWVLTIFPVLFFQLFLPCFFLSGGGVAVSSGSAPLFLTCELAYSLYSSNCCLAITPGTVNIHRAKTLFSSSSLSLYISFCHAAICMNGAHIYCQTMFIGCMFVHTRITFSNVKFWTIWISSDSSKIKKSFYSKSWITV